MKKIILILIIGIFSVNINAQSDSLANKLKINFGLMLNPQGGMSMKLHGLTPVVSQGLRPKKP